MLWKSCGKQHTIVQKRAPAKRVPKRSTPLRASTMEQRAACAAQQTTCSRPFSSPDYETRSRAGQARARPFPSCGQSAGGQRGSGMCQSSLAARWRLVGRPHSPALTSSRPARNEPSQSSQRLPVHFRRRCRRLGTPSRLGPLIVGVRRPVDSGRWAVAVQWAAEGPRPVSVEAEGRGKKPAGGQLAAGQTRSIQELDGWRGSWTVGRRMGGWLVFAYCILARPSDAVPSLFGARPAHCTALHCTALRRRLAYAVLRARPPHTVCGRQTRAHWRPSRPPFFEGAHQTTHCVTMGSRLCKED